MNRIKYLIISGAVFFSIACLHLTRILYGWQFQVGSWNIPMWASWLAFIATGLLSIWAFRQLRD